MPLLSLLVLYLSFRLKQFAGDYLLQTHWMVAGKGEEGVKGWLALAAHSGVHAAGTAIITLAFAPPLIWLAAVDFLIHGGIDRYKSRLLAKEGWGASDTKFWWAHGADQEAHNITHLVYIIVIWQALGGPG